FSALLNYRHSAEVKPHDGEGLWQGVRVLGGDVRSNYPLTLSVDDLGEDFDLHVLAMQGMGAERVAGWMQNTLEQLVQALERALPLALDNVSILDADERRHLLEDFNPAGQAFPERLTVHAQIEAQVARTPQSPALIQDGNALTYAQLNQQANRLAHYLISLGVMPDERVALCLHRGPQRLIAMLAV
ncbi:non-ribosomal peptide synthetase SyfA, partial [Pseudomonas syringae pv. actinidiae ICMP 19070]